MSNQMWNLDKRVGEEMEKAKANPLPAPTGSKADQCRSLIRGCEERDATMLENALALEAQGDSEGCWFAMASRAENQRFKERLQRDLAKLEGGQP